MTERLFENLSADQREALEVIVGGWVAEGFTTPPYGSAYYDIFEALDLSPDGDWGYDIRRPQGNLTQ